MLKNKVELELNRLQQKGVISPVQHTEWAAPIVPVVKRDGTVRICGDFKVTINPVINIESYPLPRVEELFANLSHGKYFSKLDMSNAYLQLPLSDEAQKLVTINTHLGLFRYHRLPFGVSSAPAIFQRFMETLLRGLGGTAVYLDDILVSGSTLEEHSQNLHAVFSKLSQAGLKLNCTKCIFLQTRIEYLGHIIDTEGLHPSPKKFSAIKEAPAPTRPSPSVAPLHSWEWPSTPWTRLHIDFAGPFKGHMFLVLVDAHSKWLEVKMYGT